MLRKVICLFVLSSLLLSISACGGGNKDKTGDAQSYYYEETELGGDSGLVDPAGFRINSQNQLVCNDWVKNGNLKYVIINSDGKPTGNINVDVSGNGGIFALDSQDNFYIAAVTGNTQSQGDQKLIMADKTGTISKTVDLGVVDMTSEKGGMPSGVTDIAVGSDGSIYLADPSKGIIVMDKDGNQVKTIGTQGFARLFTGRDNSLYTAGNSSQDGNFIEKLDASTGQSIWKVSLGNQKRYQNVTYSSSDDSVYLLGEEGIDRLDAAGNQPEAVLTFSDYTILTSGEFIPVFEPGFQVDSAKNIFIFTVKPPANLKSGNDDPNSQVSVPYDIFKYTLKNGTNGNESRKVITAVVRRSERYLQTAAGIFQKNNPGYKIEFEYMDGTQDPESYIQKLNTDIMAGKGPDILQTSRLPYDKYTSKGVLVDLNELIANDKSFDMNQYYTNILDGVKNGGHLYFMPAMFSFSALLANKGILDESGVTIDSSSWTWEDFREAAEKVVEKDADGNVVRTALPDVSPSDLLNYFIVFGDFSKFIDKEKKTASFDSPDFMKMLELVKSFGDSNLTSKGSFKASYADVMESMFRGAVVFMPQAMQGYIDYEAAKTAFGGNISVLSFPSENASASGAFDVGETYGIASYSKYKDKAWEFIKVLISEDVQSNMQIGGFAINKAAQKDLADQDIENTSGGKVKMGMGDKEFAIGNITQEDVDYIDSLITKLNKYSSLDDQVIQIVMDEAPAYFSGDKSVEETASLIQNRVNTYLNE